MKTVFLLVMILMNLNCFANVKAVIFDCDGTLVDSEIAHIMAWQHALDKSGINFTLDEYQQYVGKSSEAMTKMLAEKLGNDCARQLYAEKCAYFLTLCDKGLPAFEHTVQLLKALLQQKESLGIKVGVCSAAKKKEIIAHLKNIGVDGLDIVLSGLDDLNDYSDPEGVNKPKPYVYLHAMKLLGVPASECVVIEDSVTGIRSSVDAGCFTIAVPNEYTRLQDLSSAHMRIESFANLDVEQFLQMVEQSESIQK